MDPETNRSFEDIVLPHLDAAHNLGRHLTSNADDAADVLQEASIRTFRFFGGFRGGRARGWLRTIVHNTAYTWMARHRRMALYGSSEEPEIERPLEAFSPVSWERFPDDPETNLRLAENEQALTTIVDRLAPEFREVFVPREIEEFSYAQIAAVVSVPIGTVMSRLAQARRQAPDGCADWSRRGTPSGGARRAEPAALARREGLFVWSTADAQPSEGPVRLRQGYAVCEWTEGGLAHWAVADIDPQALEVFRAAVDRAS